MKRKVKSFERMKINFKDYKLYNLIVVLILEKMKSIKRDGGT